MTWPDAWSECWRIKNKRPAEIATGLLESQRIPAGPFHFLDIRFSWYSILDGSPVMIHRVAGIAADGMTVVEPTAIERLPLKRLPLKHPSFERPPEMSVRSAYKR